MRDARALTLAVLASVLIGLVVASAAVLTVSAGTLAVFTFPVRLTATPTRCDDRDDRDERDDRGGRDNRGRATARFGGTPYAPGALGSAAVATKTRELEERERRERARRECERASRVASTPVARWAGPVSSRAVVTATPALTGGGSRFLGPPAKR